MKVKDIKYPDEAIRYFKNALEELKKAPIKKGFYEDIKHVRGACGTAYLAVLHAIYGFLIQQGVSQRELPKDYAQILRMLKKYSHKNGELINTFHQVYYGLHIQGYYQGLYIPDMVKEYMSKAKMLIEKLTEKEF